MPPQPGIFALPYGTTHSLSASSSQGGGKAFKAGLTSSQQDSNMIGIINGDMGLGDGGGGGYHHASAQQQQQQQHIRQHPSSSHHAQPTILGHGHPVSHLHQNQYLLHTAQVLVTRPEMSNLYKLRLYPLSLERSALLAQLEAEERYAIECAQIAYDEERERVEEEWKKGRQRVRERLLEGIEERRRRAREEKEGEVTVGDASLDSHSRPPITRKLRNKLGTSPPPTPHPNNNHSSSISSSNTFITSNSLTGTLNGINTTHHLPFNIGPLSFLNPHSLSVDDLPSPFPLPLTSTKIANGGGGGGAASGGAAGNGSGPPNGGRRRAKGGESLLLLNATKDTEIENDLGEIRRGSRRRRGVVAPGASKTS